MFEDSKARVSGYSKYNPEAKRRRKINPLEELYPPLPCENYDVIYADPPWDYGGKMQYDKSNIKSINIGFEKRIFISAADFQYPTLKLRELKQLDVDSIAAGDCMRLNWERHGGLNIRQWLLFGTNRCIIPGGIPCLRQNLYWLLRKGAFLLCGGQET